MLKSSILLVLGISILSACSPSTTQEITTNRVITEKQKPIVPDVPVFNARNVQWVVITPANATEQFAKLSDNGQRPVYVALTESGYKATIQNLADLQAIVEKQKVVIATYEKSFD